MSDVQSALQPLHNDLQTFAENALRLAWTRRRPNSEITKLKEVFVSLVNDRRMASLHQRFSGIPGSTDVLTFQHGEIVISTETAVRNAQLFHTSSVREIHLYILHGLLHLCGFDDSNARSRQTMERLQAKLFLRAEKAIRPFEGRFSRVNFSPAPATSRRRTRKQTSDSRRRRLTRHRKSGSH